jgi:hypothetical protein
LLFIIVVVVVVSIVLIVVIAETPPADGRRPIDRSPLAPVRCIGMCSTTTMDASSSQQGATASEDVGSVEMNGGAVGATVVDSGGGGSGEGLLLLYG